MRLRLERIPEEDHEIDPVLDDSGSHLLVATEWTAEKPADRESKLGAEERAGGSRRIEVVVREVPLL